MNFLGERYGIIREWLKDFSRDGEWRPTRNQFIKKFDSCECCGSKTDLNVHHVYPVRWYPYLELEPYNLITLCRKHHFDYGHFRNWQKWNPDVWEMAQLYKRSYDDFEYAYNQLKEGHEPDYTFCLKQLKQRSGRLIQGQ